MNLLLNLFGAAQLGIVLNSWMVGLICVQGYNYYLHFPRDKMIIKLLVAWVVGLQVFNLLVQTVMIYHYLVVSFGDYDRLANVAWEWAVYLGLISFAACSVQLFYAHRIFLLSGRNYLIYGVIVVLALAGLGMCSTITIFALTSDRDFATLGGLSWLVQAWLCVDGACDLLIAVFQVYYLYRGRGELVKMKKFVNTLILYFISTGLLTSILVLVELSTFAALGFNFSHVFLSYQMGAIHAMSFLANLHARRKASLMTGGVVLMDSSSRTADGVSHTSGAVSGEQWPVKMNPLFEEKTTTQFSTMHSSDSGAIETVVLTHLDDNTTNYLGRAE